MVLFRIVNPGSSTTHYHEPKRCGVLEGNNPFCGPKRTNVHNYLPLLSEPARSQPRDARQTLSHNARCNTCNCFPIDKLINTPRRDILTLALVTSRFGSLAFSNASSFFKNQLAFFRSEWNHQTPANARSEVTSPTEIIASLFPETITSPNATRSPAPIA